MMRRRRRDYLYVELLDAFGTVVARGKIDVVPEAITPAVIAGCNEDGPIMRPRSRLATLREFPDLRRAIIASSYVQDGALNPSFPMRVVVHLG